MRVRSFGFACVVIAATLFTVGSASAPKTSRPAVQVHPATALAPGAGPIAIRYAEWMSDTTFKFEAGELISILRLRPPSYELAAIDHDSNVAGFLFPKSSSQVGDLADPSLLQPNIQPNGRDANLEPSFWAVQECYVPLYLFGNPNERRITAYVRVRIEAIPVDPNFPSHQQGDLYMKVTKLKNHLHPGRPWIALHNAVASFNGNQPTVVFPNSGTLGWHSLIDRLTFLPNGTSPFTAIADSRVYVP